MEYEDFIRRAKAAYETGMQEAAEYLFGCVLKYPDRPLQAMCKEVAGEDGWEALRMRVRRMQEKARSEGDSGRSGPDKPEWKKRDERGARQVARENPVAILSDADARQALIETIANDPDAVRQVARLSVKTRPETEPRPRPEVDIDKLYQDAAAQIVYREADRRAGRWHPNDTSEAHREMLRRIFAPVSDDPRSIEKLHDEITQFLEEVTL